MRCSFASTAVQHNAHRFLFIIPTIVGLITLGLYNLLGHTLELDKTVSVLALLNVVRYPITLLLNAVNSASEGRVAMVRLATFLSLPELDPHARLTMSDERSATSAEHLALTPEEREQATRLLDGGRLAIRIAGGEFRCAALSNLQTI